MVKQYLDHSKEILSSDSSRFKFNERRGLGRIYLFGYQNRYDLDDGFPILTTKKIHYLSNFSAILLNPSTSISFCFTSDSAILLSAVADIPIL